MPTVPGVPTPIKALCVVPFGMEEGTREVIREKEFGLVVGEDAGGTVIPVWLESAFTEVGTLEIWCVSREDERRWKLEFNLRESES